MPTTSDARYGSDRPDRGWERRSTTLRTSSGARSSGLLRSDRVRRGGAGLKASGEFPRSRFDNLTERARSLGAKGLVWGTVEDGGWKSPVAEFLSDAEMSGAIDALGAGAGDAFLIVADQAAVAAEVLGELRVAVADTGPEGNDLFWVVDFPMFEWNEDESRWDPLHHPFTSPTGDLENDPGTWRSRAYDVVWNGWELGGGSIRISHPDVQQKVFDALGIAEDEARERFGFLLEALRYGAPPHGGIAFGIDRWVALMAGHARSATRSPSPRPLAGWTRSRAPRRRSTSASCASWACASIAPLTLLAFAAALACAPAGLYVEPTPPGWEFGSREGRGPPRRTPTLANAGPTPGPAAASRGRSSVTFRSSEHRRPPGGPARPRSSHGRAARGRVRRRRLR